MNKLKLLQDLQAEHAKMLKRIESLKDDVKSLSEVTEQVKKMAADKGLRLVDIALAIAPELNDERAKGRGAAGVPRAPRTVKTFANPHTGEIVETKGGNHKMLKAWKDKYGADTVATWQKKS